MAGRPKVTTRSITADRYRAIRAEAERRIAARRAGTPVGETLAAAPPAVGATRSTDRRPGTRSR